MIVKTARARGQYQQQFQDGYQANKKTKRTYPFSKMSDERKQKKKTMIFKIRVMPLFLKRCVFFARAEITIQDDCHNWRDSYIYNYYG